MPNDHPSIQWLRDNCDDFDELVTMDGFDDCIAGLCVRFGQEPVVIYDMAKVLGNLVAGGMSEDEAEEYWGFNQIGAYVGERTPAFVRMVGG